MSQFYFLPPWTASPSGGKQFMPYRLYAHPYGRPAAGWFQLIDECLEKIALINLGNPKAIHYNARRHKWSGLLIRQHGGEAGRVIEEWPRRGKTIYRMAPGWTIFNNNKVLALGEENKYLKIAALSFYDLLDLDVKEINAEATPSTVHKIYNWRRRSIVYAGANFPVLSPFTFPMNTIKGDGVYVRRKDLVAG